MRSNAVKRIPVATHGIWDETAVCFNYKHSDGGIGGGCSVVVVVSTLAL